MDQRIATNFNIMYEEICKKIDASAANKPIKTDPGSPTIGGGSQPRSRSRAGSS